MANDELATVRTLTAYRAIMTRIIQEFRGRVVDSPGDNLLAEFPSVVDGVGCAVQIQGELKPKNRALPEERRMAFRIGVNLGDVIQEGERIYGDGVNIAARIEGLAEPEGICISGPAYDQVENKAGFEYEYLGEHRVKNIIKPVRVYKILMEPEPRLPVGGGENAAGPFGHWKMVFAALILLVGVVGGVLTVKSRFDGSSTVLPTFRESPEMEGPKVQKNDAPIMARIEKIREALSKPDEDVDRSPTEKTALEEARLHAETQFPEDERRKEGQGGALKSGQMAAAKRMEEGVLLSESERLKAGVKQPRSQVEQRSAESNRSDFMPAKVRLRNGPTSVGLSDFRTMLKRFNFFLLTDNETGVFHNDFEDLGADVVIDKTTGLMWEKGGSSSPLCYADAVDYVEKLNEKGLAGYKDWRIPTLEELCSLLQSQMKGDEVFPGAEGWRPPSQLVLRVPEGSPEMGSYPNSRIPSPRGERRKESIFPLVKPCWTCDINAMPLPPESFRRHYVVDLFSAEAYSAFAESDASFHNQFVKAVRTAAK